MEDDIIHSGGSSTRESSGPVSGERPPVLPSFDLAPEPEIESPQAEPVPPPYWQAALPPPVYIPPPPPRPLICLLAGVESGILGGLVMILWFALDAVMERQHWWAMLNLWGAPVYHNQVFSMGFGRATLAGAATHFLLHGLGGAAWGLIAGTVRNFWLHLVWSLVAAAVWYVFLMTAVWPYLAPVVTRITPHPATLLAYVLFGATLSRSAQRARRLGANWIT